MSGTTRLLMLLAAATVVPPAPLRPASPAAPPARSPRATTAPTTGAAGAAVASEQVVVPRGIKCQWSDLLSVALRGGRLEVALQPPPAIAEGLATRKSVELEIDDASDRFWRVQALPPQRQPGVVAVGGAAAARVVVIPGGMRVRIELGNNAAGGAGAGNGGAADAAGANDVVGVAGAAPEAPPMDFHARARVTGRPGETPRPTEMTLMQGTFRIRSRWLRDEKVLQIDFRSYTDKSNVALSVSELTRGRRRPVLVVESGDLYQLRRERPDEVRLYLEPLLAEISGGRNPLLPQAGDVYRAFESIPPDSQASERVMRLVETFDALDPAVREAASAELNRLGRPEVLAAARVDRSNLSAEQALRLDAFIARHSTVTDIAAAGRDPLFLIDCLRDEDRAVRAAALRRLRETTGRAIEFDIDAPAEHRAATATALAKEFEPPPPPPPPPAAR